MPHKSAFMENVSTASHRRRFAAIKITESKVFCCIKYRHHSRNTNHLGSEPTRTTRRLLGNKATRTTIATTSRRSYRKREFLISSTQLFSIFWYRTEIGTTTRPERIESCWSTTGRALGIHRSILLIFWRLCTSVACELLARKFTIHKWRIPWTFSGCARQPSVAFYCSPADLSPTSSKTSPTAISFTPSWPTTTLQL